MSDLHIPKEAPLKAKIWKLAVSIHEAKADVENFQFELMS